LEHHIRYLGPQVADKHRVLRWALDPRVRVRIRGGRRRRRRRIRVRIRVRVRGGRRRRDDWSLLR